MIVLTFIGHVSARVSAHVTTERMIIMRYLYTNGCTLTANKNRGTTCKRKHYIIKNGQRRTATPREKELLEELRAKCITREKLQSRGTTPSIMKLYNDSIMRIKEELARCSK